MGMVDSQSCSGGNRTRLDGTGDEKEGEPGHLVFGDRFNLHCWTGGDLARLRDKNISSFWFLAFIHSHLTPHALIIISARRWRLLEI